jgi:hypothetical protein
MAKSEGKSGGAPSPPFSRGEARQLREAWRAGHPLHCPRCALPLSPTVVPPRSDVAYVRRRTLLLCEGCGGSLALEDRERASPKGAGKEGTKPLVGWREWVRIEPGTQALKAKVDTGARTSALHAMDLTPMEGPSGAPWLRFTVYPLQRTARKAFALEAPLVDHRSIRSSSGSSEERPVVLLELSVGGLRFPAEVTLTRRDQMGFRMLLGRTALQGRFCVDPSASFLQGDPLKPGLSESAP